MQNLSREVIFIRRIRFLILMLVLLAGFTALVPEARAATLSSKAGAVTTSGSVLNVRRQPSSGAPVVAKLKKGSYITLISKSGSWWQVEYGNGQYGYCHSDYITIVQGTPVTVATNGGSLNVRSGPGTGYAKTATLYKGQAVLLLTTANGWSRVLYHGTKTGYVSAQYLSNDYAPVSLSVPSYKQNDSRWAGTLIGSSGKTMKEIGCATTAVAMLESYRRGITVYPDAMAQELRYTSSGNLYWPSHYQTVTAYSLREIYARLKQGRPVLLGASNAYGAQHWVVITGYAGGTALTASGFTIHDPGTWSRTNLQQFFSAYPNFYKYFYY